MIATSPSPAAGGTGLLTYRPYRGKLRGPANGVWAIARSGLKTIIRRRLFWGLSADWDVVPDLPALTSALQHAFAELHAAAETAPAGRTAERATG